jgi:hypothetical protein
MGRRRCVCRRGGISCKHFDEEELWLLLIDEACRCALDGNEKEALATASVATHVWREAEVDREALRKRFATHWTKSATWAEQELSVGVSRMEGELG